MLAEPVYASAGARTEHLAGPAGRLDDGIVDLVHRLRSRAAAWRAARADRHASLLGVG